MTSLRLSVKQGKLANARAVFTVCKFEIEIPCFPEIKKNRIKIKIHSGYLSKTVLIKKYPIKINIPLLC